MSKKLVTDALASPHALGELKRYHKKQLPIVAKRGLIVILASCLILLHTVVNFIPIQSNNNADETSDTIYGGISSKQDLLLRYDQKDSQLYMASESLSIHRKDIENIQETTLSQWVDKQKNTTIAWSTSPIYKLFEEPIDAKPQNNFVATNSTKTFLYYGHLVNGSLLSSGDTAVISGYSKKTGRFAIIKSNGNFLTSTYNADSCYEDPETNISYGNCPNSNSFRTSIGVTNIDYKTDATFLKNHPNDRLQYTIVAQNTSNNLLEFRPEIFIGDILEYASLVSVDNARYDETSKKIEWNSITMQPNQQINLTFTVKILDKMPLTARGSTNGTSYDCYISAFFGTMVNTKVTCPVPKVIEKVLSSPESGSLLALGWIVLILNILIFLKIYIFTQEHELIIRHNTRRRHE